MNYRQYTLIASLFLSTALAHAQETVSRESDQTALALTIYNQDLALVKDQRTIGLQKGEQQLAFEDVSARIQPESVILTALDQAVPAPRLIEQNFEFDLLTPQALLDNAVGETVTLVRTHPTTGEDFAEPATVLSTEGGTVLQLPNRVEVNPPGRIVFGSVPAQLRARPTLLMTLDSEQASEQALELSYLTTGLGWQANYVAELNADESALDLTGWVTLNNQSGITYRDAQIQLVAGDVNRVSPMKHIQQLGRSMRADEGMAANVQEEALFDYHLYTLERPTDIANKQIKQVALMSANLVPVQKAYVLRGQEWFYFNRIDPQEDLKVATELSFVNDKTSHLGLPLPKGIIRLYQADSKGSAQFIGEDRIDHTPENKRIVIKPGNAFDITASKTQQTFKQRNIKNGNLMQTETIIGTSITIANAKMKRLKFGLRKNFPVSGPLLTAQLQKPAKGKPPAGMYWYRQNQKPTLSLRCSYVIRSQRWRTST